VCEAADTATDAPEVDRPFAPLAGRYQDRVIDLLGVIALNEAA
jgi:hypothetical protein